MCHFVIAVLPASAPLPALEAVARTHDRALRPFANATLQAQLRPDQRAYVTTSGHCDCGTVLGHDLGAGRARADADDEHRRLARKGWSEAKIARALGHKRDHEAAEAAKKHAAVARDRARWMAFVNDMVSPGRGAEFGLLVHMFRGGFDEEDFVLDGSEAVRIDAGLGDALGAMRDDVLYFFRR